jgi:hypothetical protein
MLSIIISVFQIAGLRYKIGVCHVFSKKKGEMMTKNNSTLQIRPLSEVKRGSGVTIKT